MGVQQSRILGEALLDACNQSNHLEITDDALIHTIIGKCIDILNTLPESAHKTILDSLPSAVKGLSRSGQVSQRRELPSPTEPSIPQIEVDALFQTNADEWKQSPSKFFQQDQFGIGQSSSLCQYIATLQEANTINKARLRYSIRQFYLCRKSWGHRGEATFLGKLDDNARSAVGEKCQAWAHEGMVYNTFVEEFGPAVLFVLPVPRRRAQRLRADVNKASEDYTAIALDLTCRGIKDAIDKLQPAAECISSYLNKEQESAGLICSKTEAKRKAQHHHPRATEKKKGSIMPWRVSHVTQPSASCNTGNPSKRTASHSSASGGDGIATVVTAAATMTTQTEQEGSFLPMSRMAQIMAGCDINGGTEPGLMAPSGSETAQNTQVPPLDANGTHVVAGNSEPAEAPSIPPSQTTSATRNQATEAYQTQSLSPMVQVGQIQQSSTPRSFQPHENNNVPSMGLDTDGSSIVGEHQNPPMHSEGPTRGNDDDMAAATVLAKMNNTSGASGLGQFLPVNTGKRAHSELTTPNQDAWQPAKRQETRQHEAGELHDSSSMPNIPRSGSATTPRSNTPFTVHQSEPPIPQSHAEPHRSNSTVDETCDAGGDLSQNPQLPFGFSTTEAHPCENSTSYPDDTDASLSLQDLVPGTGISGQGVDEQRWDALWENFNLNAFSPLTVLDELAYYDSQEGVST